MAYMSTEARGVEMMRNDRPLELLRADVRFPNFTQCESTRSIEAMT